MKTKVASKNGHPIWRRAKIVKWIKDNKIVCLVFLLIIYIFCEQVVYSLLEQRPPVLDETHYLFRAVEYYRLLTARPEGFVKKLLSVSPQHRPPLYPFSGTLLYLIFGVSYSAFWLRFSNGLWIALALWSIYKIGERSFSKKVGLTATVIFLGLCSVFAYQRGTMSETAFTAVTAFAIWQLIRTRYFTNFRASLWLGVSLAMGLLVKTNFFFFLFLPVGFSFLVGLIKSAKEERINVIGNFLSSLLVAMVISTPYYVANFSKIIEYTTINQILGPQWVPEKQYFLYYLFALHDDISTPYFFYFLIGLLLFPIFFLWAKQRKTEAILVLLWFLSGYLSHALLITHKDTRFMFAYYPAVALLAAYWIFSIKKRGVRWFLIGMICLIALYDHWGSSWGWPEKFTFQKEWRTSNPHNTFRLGSRPYYYYAEKNNIRGLLKYLDKYVSSYKKANPKVATVTGKRYNEAAMRELYSHSIPHSFIWESLIGIDDWGISRNVPFRWQEFLDADLIVLKTGEMEETIQGLKIADFVKDFTEAVPQLSQAFEHLTSIPISDAETYEVYRRVKAADKEEKLLLLYEALRLESSWPENYKPILKEATIYFSGEWSEENEIHLEQELQKFIKVKRLDKRICSNKDFTMELFLLVRSKS